MKYKISFVSGTTYAIMTETSKEEMAELIRKKKISIIENGIINWGYVEDVSEIKDE